MDACLALKRFSSACPFLRASPVSALRSYSTQRSLVPAPGGNRLAELATTQCPLMRVALVHKAQGLHTRAADSVAAATSEANHKAPKSSASTPAGATTIARGYASIAEIQQDAVRRAVDPEQAAPAFVNPASISSMPSSSSQGVGAGEVHDPNQTHAELRPTCALGFAKHNITSHRPGFDYEAFYGSELTKKHQDKSYRVRLPLAGRRRPAFNAAAFLTLFLSRARARSTSTTSTGSLPSTPSLTRPTRRMK